MSFPDPFSIMIAMNVYRTTPHVSIREVCDPKVVDHKYGSGVASRTSRQSRGFVASNQHRLKFCDVLNEANEMHKKTDPATSLANVSPSHAQAQLEGGKDSGFMSDPTYSAKKIQKERKR